MSTLARVLLNGICLFKHNKILLKMGRNKFQGGNKRKFDKPKEHKDQGYKYQESDKRNDDFTAR